MQRIDDTFRLSLLRAVAVLLLVYVVTAMVVYGETGGWRDWSGAMRWALPILLFDACYTWIQVNSCFNGDRVLMRRLFWVSAGLLVSLHFVMDEMTLVTSFVAFWVAQTPRFYPLRICSRLAGAAVAFFLLMYYLRGEADLAGLLVLSILMPAVCFFVMTTSYIAISLQSERAQALALNRELKAAQLQLAQSSRTGERLRIAREIHDLLGHQMTGLILNLEVAKHKTTGEGLAHVERGLALAKMLLGDLRNAVSDLRDSPALDFDAALTELLANVPGLKVKLERDPELSVDDPAMAEVLLRCIQESLTNTLRHAGATFCSIKLYRQGTELVLEVSDDGVSPLQVKPGNGLKGMQERIAALAGKLSWHGGSGFHLQARLPLVEVTA